MTKTSTTTSHLAGDHHPQLRLQPLLRPLIPDSESPPRGRTSTSIPDSHIPETSNPNPNLLTQSPPFRTSTQRQTPDPDSSRQLGPPLDLNLEPWCRLQTGIQVPNSDSRSSVPNEALPKTTMRTPDPDWLGPQLLRSQLRQTPSQDVDPRPEFWSQLGYLTQNHNGDSQLRS